MFFFAELKRKKVPVKMENLKEKKLPPPTDPTRLENSVGEQFFLVGFENFSGLWKIFMGTICNDRSKRAMTPLPAGV